jgi:hypothetical protein
MDFVYHTFVPVCTLKDRNSEAPIVFMDGGRENAIKMRAGA